MTEKCFHQLFTEQAEKTPDHIAVVYENEQLTYRELNQRANQLAHHLQKLGVKSEILVALCLERSLETIIGILGILKAGGAYVPLDPVLPQERLGFMIEDSQASVLLTQQTLKENFRNCEIPVISIDDDWETIAKESQENPESDVETDNLVYVIFTSGSTGKPKGVAVEHQQLLNYLYSIIEKLELPEKANFATVSTFATDLGNTVIFPALMSGGCLHIIAQDRIGDPDALADYCASHPIDCLKIVPSHLNALLKSSQPDKILPRHQLVLGGDVCTWTLIKNIQNLAPNCKILNHYGPSETTIGVLTYPIKSEVADSLSPVVPIGLPIANTQIYILDPHLKQTPTGVSGEIYIAGASVARGYLHRPDLTKEKFISNPFSADPQARMYRTGDLARYLPDGNIEFLGRIDNQVKIRGFRIEIGEIIALLAQYPDVQELTVIDREDHPGDKRLVAYIVAKPGKNISTGEVRQFLKQQLPEYMIPSAFVVLENLPLTPNGKIDRRALPKPEEIYQAITVNFIAPQTELQIKIAQIWEEVLNIRPIGIDNNFFELGGHSLLATQVVSRIRQNLKVNLSLRQLFAAPTVESLAAWIESNDNSESKLRESIIHNISRENIIPLSYNQEGLWFLWQLESNNDAYNISKIYQLTGELDITALSKSWTQVVKRHQPLRTVFSILNGEPRQVIHETEEIEIPVIDLHNLPTDERQVVVNQLQQEITNKPFDLTDYPLWRVKLIKLSANEHLLLITIHHIIFDEWSWDLLFSKIAAFYSGFLVNETTRLVDLPINYADFTHWQRQWLQGESFNNLMQYWQQELAGIEPVLDLPTDKPRSTEISFRGATEPIQLSSSLSAALTRFSQKQGVTLFMTLLAAFEILLYRYSGQTDIVIGSPIAGRNREEVERLIGFFVNTIVLRNDLGENTSFIELLDRVKEITLGAYEHQDLPFDKLVQELNPERSLSYHPIFQVMFAWQNGRGRSLELPGLDITHISQDVKISKFDLTLELEETDKGITGFFEYRTDLFESATIKRMVGHFQTLLEAIVANPNTKIAHLPLLTPQEQQQLLVDWNNTTFNYPQYNCIHQLIEQQVQRTPEAIAVVWENQKLTYQELNTKANQIAHCLRFLGVQPEVRVGICVERCLEMIVGILAILKAGGAYLPLDPAYPPERLEFMLSDAQVPVILTKSELVENLPHHQAQVICLDTDESIFAQQSSENPSHQTQPHNLAYIIYTSGSTGKPKGTMIEHRSLINAYLAWEDAYHLSSQTSSHLQMASFSFDVCSGDFVRALCSGAKLVICPKDFLLDPKQLYTLMQQEKIDCADFVPAVLRNLIQYLEQTNQNLAFMKLLVAGSDSWYLSEYKHIRNLCGSQTRLINAYGVSEATIDTTYFETEIVDLSFDRFTPIGRPFANNQVYLLDDNMQPVPIGVPGELYIGGAGLARGYFNRPDLTEDKFIPHPFADYFPHNPDQRLYKTNDKARYLADGNIEFLGRLDNQVKIRGFRIELGEIESLVNQHPQIKESIVIVREDVPGDKRIVAYIVFQPEQQVSDQELRDYLSQKLPNHFIPSAYVSLDALPLTPNGKLDRKALPVPEYNLVTDHNFVAPSTQTETVLATIWSQILGLERVSINDNFFELGGHSLLIVQVINAIARELSIDISVRQVFQAPTLAELAVIIDSSAKNSQLSTISIIPQRPNPESAALSFAQQRLWFLEQLEPGRVDYHISSGYRFLGSLNIPVLQQALDAIVVYHEVLRTNFITEDGEAIQVIRPPRPVELSIVNLQEIPASQQQQEIQKLLQREQEHPFNLSEDLMLRGCLLQISPQEQILLLIMHHIASDGWSSDILAQQLSEVYTAFLNGQPNPLTPMPIQYADFALWQRQWLSGEELDRQLQYWKQQLTGANTILELPTDRPRPPIQTYSGGSQSWVLGKNLTTALKNLCLQEKVTLYMTLLAAFTTLLSRHSGQDDILVGSPIAGRQKPELEKMIGFFVNSLVLRIDLSGNPTFQELLNRTLQVALDGYTYQDFPFEKLVEELKLKRDLSRNPLFQVWFNMLNLENLDLEFPGLVVEPISLPGVFSKFDITLYVQELEAEIHLHAVYNSDLFSYERIAEMLSQFEHLLTQVVAAPAKRISELSLITQTAQTILPNPQKPLLTTWTGAVHNLCSQQAEKVPENIAIGDKKGSWSYRELEERTNFLANYLVKHEIKPQDVVAIYGNRSASLVWAILGVLKAGAAFVILDPAYPTSRLIDYLQISQPRGFIKVADAGELPTAISEYLDQCLENTSCNFHLEITSESIEIVRQKFQNYGNHDPEVEVTADDLAYVSFTSGSTGKPKGILGIHRPLSHFLEWHIQTFGLKESDRFSMVSGLSHDPLLRDIFTPLSLGATLYIPEQQEIETPGRLAEWMVEKQITVSHLTPAMGQLLTVNTNVINNHQRYFFFGGDILNMQDVERIHNFAPYATCVNFYGATETPQAMGYFIVPKPEERNFFKENIPVGKGIADVQLLILNQEKYLAGIGELGEIYVRTPYLTKGYIGSAEMTEERFIINPLRKIPEDKVYKTGDLGRYLPNGNIEFLGRSDYQVKIRGFRVELGEIEALLSQHPTVKDNIVMAREDVPGNKGLIAYIVLNQESASTSSELRQFLKKQLPDYMVPSNFVILEALPLTPNGKIDRNALPTPDYVRQEPKETFVAPHDELEIQLTKIWEKVLGVQPIGIRDNFFELGGHSLIAVLLFAEIEKIFGKTLPLATLFQAQTIEELAAVCRNKEWSAPWSPVVLIQPDGSKPPLFFIHPIGGNILEYSDIIQCLGQERPIYGIQALGLDGKAPLNRVEDMAEYYIKEIRSILPNGPYFLAGYSFGGLVAFEMAQQLHTQGQKVGLLALLDRTAPNVVGSRSSLAKYLRVHLTNLWQLNNQEKFGYIKGLLQWYLNKSSYKDVLIQNLPEVVENSNIINVIEANIQASNSYKAKAYPGVLTLFRCNVQPVRWADYPDLGWGNSVGDLEIHALPGDHNNILKKPHVQVLSEKLKSCLEKAESGD